MAATALFSRFPRLRKFLLYIVACFGLFLLLDFLFPFNPAISYSQVITDYKGRIIRVYLSEDQQWRMACRSDDISEVLRKALLAKEDKWFYYHPGVNPLAMLRAFIYNIFSGRRTSGASTITMQVVRMLHPAPRTYIQKCIESWHALQLEWHFSKDEILELYFNLVPYGGNIQGIRAASYIYFGESPGHLSMARIAMLTVIPNKPGSLKPGKNDSLLLQYRNKWLQRLKDEGVFPESEIKLALNEPLGAQRRPIPDEAPHFCSLLRKKFGRITSIQSSLNLNSQQQSSIILKQYMHRLRSDGIYNAAVLVIDNQTGKVVTYIGSPDFRDKLHQGEVDAVQALRSPGSTLKPFIYGTCFEQGLLTPKHIMLDVPESFDGYEPENFDKAFNGAVTVEEALCKSLNIPAVKALQMVGKNLVMDRFYRAGCNSLGTKYDRYGLSLALGGCEMSLWQLCGLYHALWSQGDYKSISLLKKDTAVRGYQFLSAPAAYMVTDILSRRDRPEMPEGLYNNLHLPRIAWKTGTSYGRRDAWSIGFSKNYTIGVWIGNCSGKGHPALSGAEIATPLLFALFHSLDYNNDGSWVKPPKELGFRLVCSKTGKIPSEQCEQQVADFCIPGISRQDICDHRVKLYISANGKYSYCVQCLPVAGYREQWFENIEPPLAAYYDREKIHYYRIPPHNPSCHRIFGGKAPVIILPVSGQKYMIEKGTEQLLALQAACDPSCEKVYWYINDQFLREAPAGEKVFFQPQPGTIKISVTDDKGRTTHLLIEVAGF